MGFLDDVKKGARKFGDTIYEQNFTEKGQREQREKRIKSFNERARETRAEAGLLRAQKQRDRYRSPPPSFGMGPGPSDISGLSGFGLPQQSRPRTRVVYREKPKKRKTTTRRSYSRQSNDPASFYGY